LQEFQKNIYFCFTDYAKAFDCVDHNKLWKILQEMGIPDRLTCLLRNLYAGQEATVRTGHGTTDWFQIGKDTLSSVKNSQECSVIQGRLVCGHSIYDKNKLQKGKQDFPSGPVDKNPPANAGGTSLIPGPEDFTCLGATKLTSHNYRDQVPQLPKPE